MQARNIIFLVVLVLEILYVIFIIAKKSNHNFVGYMSLGLVLKLIFFTGWLMLFSKYEEIKPTGEYEVAYISENYIDDNRVEKFKDDRSKREIEVGIWYPKDINKKCPYIVFSHGSFGTIDNNKTLCMELASKSYIVSSRSHTYHAEKISLMNEIRIIHINVMTKKH